MSPMNWESSNEQCYMNMFVISTHDPRSTLSLDLLFEHMG